MNNPPSISVAGKHIRCISSNIRIQEKISWTDVQVQSGIGYEGNIILAQVSEIGGRRAMECINGPELFDVDLQKDDYIIGVLANRHSGTSEYGEVPSEGIYIGGREPLDLLSAGGIVGHCLGMPKSLGEKATGLRTIGLLYGKDGILLDLAKLYPRWDAELLPSAPIVLSCGTAAEVGKTTAAKNIIRAYRQMAVSNVAAVKLTGTGRKRDIYALASSGAFPAYDFPDVGLPTTYTSAERLLSATYTLLNKVNRDGSPEVIIGECGGDIIEGNVPTLLKDPHIMSRVSLIIHSSFDVLGIIGSLRMYEEWGILARTPIILTYPYMRNFKAMKTRLDSLGISTPIIDSFDEIELTGALERFVSL